MTLRASWSSLARRVGASPWEGLAMAAAVIALALDTHSHHLHGLPDLLLATAVSLAVCLLCGAPLARRLISPEWGAMRGCFALPLGAAVSGLVLFVWGILHVPLHVSLWVTLALGAWAGRRVRRRERARVEEAGAEEHEEPRLLSHRTQLSWAIVLAAVFVLALLPALRLGIDTVYGSNPDSHQVTGSAVLFEHVPPTATDTALPIDTVPPSWRFRYPIFYPLAAASMVSHLDPIKVFPAFSALLLVMAAFGFGAFAVRGLGAPERAAPLVSAATGASVISLHLVWHPYWNQLWCLAMLPYALLFGWRSVVAPNRRDGILLVLALLMLAVAYPLGLPDPVVVILALVVACRPRLRRPRISGARGWAGLVLALLVLLPVTLGAALKLGQGLGQFFSTGGSLWGGDVKSFVPLGMFVGAGGGAVAAAAVIVFALLGLTWLERRQGWALGIGLAVLALVDVRFRVVSAGAYMDFKQLSFVGPIVLTLAVAAAVWLMEAVPWASLGRAASGAWAGAVACLVLLCGWWVAAIREDRRENLATQVQVTPQMLQIRQWVAALPPRASVRVDIPPSGLQLWAVYMLGAHPVDSPEPILNSTYAHAPYGLVARYSLSLRMTQTPDPAQASPVAPILYARDPPVAENSQFVLRRIVWPARVHEPPDTSSQTLVEP